MAKDKGVCRNIDGCSKAISREVQEAEKSNFVCEECKKDLKPVGGGPGPSSGSTGGKSKVLYYGIGLLVTIAVVVLFFVFKPTAEDNIMGGSDYVEIPQSGGAANVVEVVETDPQPGTPAAEEEVPATVVQPATTTTTTTTTAPSNTLSFAYGKYTGDIKNGKADGQGKMVYSTRTLISKYDRKQRYAEPGQYIIGTWYNNLLDNGQLFAPNGDMLEVITIGRAE